MLKQFNKLELTALVIATVCVLTGITLLYKGHFTNKSVVKEVETNFIAQSSVATQKTAVVTKKVTSITAPVEQIVVLSGEIGENALFVAEQITKKSKNLDGEPIYLLISSPGGSVVAGAQVINAIEASPVPVNTVCMDLCASMAAIIHQYGTKRMMLDRSILMFHDAAGGFQGYFPHVNSLFRTIERYITRFNTHISVRSGMSLADLELAEHVQLWIDAEDALATKFTDKLVYIDVTSNDKGFTMKSLFPKALTPTPTTTTPNKLFDLYW